MDVREWRRSASGKHAISIERIDYLTLIVHARISTLPKRHYDMALETNTEAYLPVILSLVKLHARSIWHTLTGGKNGLDLWSFDEETGRSGGSLLRIGTNLLCA